MELVRLKNDVGGGRGVSLSIRWRMTIWYTVVVALTLTVFSLGVYWYLGSSLIRDVDARSLERALQVEQRIDRAVAERQAFVERTLPPERYNELREQGLLVESFDPFQTPGVGVRVWDSRGMLVDASDELLDATRLRDYQPVIYALQGHEHRYVLHTDEGPFYSYSYPYFGGSEQPVAVIQILTSLNPYVTTMGRLSRLLIVGTALASALAFIVGAALAQTALKPIENITRTAQQINRARDLDRRIPSRGPRDEIGRLTETINEMLDRIEAIFDRQRQFMADVSHELRTPLTTIRGEVELMQRTGQMDEEGLSAVCAESARMSRLVGDLLLLAQADQQLALDKEPVGLAMLMEEVYRQAQRLAGDERSVALVHTDDAVVMGDHDRLKQLMLNLVSNAVTHTPPGTHIDLAVYREPDGQARLVVADDGPGIPADHVEHLFDRFYRVDKARARSGDGGSGLGLAIASWIASIHGGTIEADSELGDGAVFTVRLPLAGSEQPVAANGRPPATA
jgi:heavy metal sensor kinase